MLIGEVARRSGVSARMLRHYECLGLLTPAARTGNGYRDYSAADIGRIFHIEGLRRLGMSLTEVGAVLAEPGFDPSRLLTDLIAQSRDRIVSEQRMLGHLEQVNRLGHADSEALLRTIDLMRSLESADVIQRHKAALGSGVDGSVPVATLSQAVLGESVLNAAGAMRWALVQAGPAAVDHLLSGMDEGAVEVRRNGLRALDEIRRNTSAAELGAEVEARICAALRKGLGDADAQIRSLAALALGRSRDPATVPELLDLALNGPKDIDAAEALAAYVAADTGAEAGAGTGAEADTGAGEDAAAAAEIMSWLRRFSLSARSSDRFRVLQVLLEIPGDAATALIAGLADDESAQVAATATAALRRRGPGRLGEGAGTPCSRG